VDIAISNGDAATSAIQDVDMQIFLHIREYTIHSDCNMWHMQHLLLCFDVCEASLMLINVPEVYY